MKLSVSESHKIIFEIFLSIGCTENDSNIIADVLVSAEKRGIPSHGFVRIKDYLGLWKQNRININPDIHVVHETPSTLLIDGDNCFGMLVGKYAMAKAIQKAKDTYTCWVAVRNSNHFGIAGYYSMMALEHDMIGISMTNANPLVAPTFSTEKLLGTNPLAVAIPANEEPPFIADFATTPIARGKLELLEKMNKKAESGFVQDKDGHPSDNPSILKEGGAILPLGGDYIHGSHKGYCMSAIVDIFSAVFSGANFGPFVPPQVAYLNLNPLSTGKGLGHFFGAIRTDSFLPADEFKSNMDKWIRTFRKAATVEGVEHVIIPGEPERQQEKNSEINGLEINDVVLKELRNKLVELSLPCIV